LPPEAESSLSNQIALPKLSAAEQNSLSTSRIADYLEGPTTSHIHRQHVSSEESKRILTEKMDLLKAVDNALSGNKQ
jgi:hypothetical protein